MVSLNRAHLAVEPLLALVSTRSRLVDRLTSELDGWSDLAGAWLFGSTARGDGGPDSDIDLLVVASRSIDSERWARRSTDLVTNAEAWTGNTVQLVEHTRRTFAQLVQADNPLVSALRTEGIPLTAKSRQLLRRAA
jgi:predicted nucleotidyltransferase